MCAPVSLVFCDLVGVACIQHVDEPRRLRQPVRLGERIEFDARDLQINAMAYGLLLHRRQGLRTPRQGGQGLRKREREIVFPQPERSDQFFARAGRTLARHRKLRRDVSVKDLLAGLVELVHGAGLAQPLGKLCRGLGGGICLREEIDLLARRHRAVVGAPCCCRDAQGFKSCKQLRLSKPIRGDFGTRRQGSERKNASDNLAINLGFSGT